MGQGERQYGLRLNARGHGQLVLIYGALLLVLAAFGAGRLRETVPHAVAYVAAIRERGHIFIATRQAFARAIRTNAARPRPNPLLPHRIPVYPRLARRRHQEGTVLLRLVVLPSGEVGAAKVIKSSGFDQLDAAALVGVGGWYYIPAVRNHHPVAAAVLVRISFHLGAGPPPRRPATG